MERTIWWRGVTTTQNMRPIPMTMPVTNPAMFNSRHIEIQINQEFELRKFQTVIFLIPQIATHIEIIKKIFNINNIRKKTLIKSHMITKRLLTKNTKTTFKNRLKNGKLTPCWIMKLMKNYNTLRIFQNKNTRKTQWTILVAAKAQDINTIADTETKDKAITTLIHLMTTFMKKAIPLTMIIQSRNTKNPRTSPDLKCLNQIRLKITRLGNLLTTFIVTSRPNKQMVELTPITKAVKKTATIQMKGKLQRSGRDSTRPITLKTLLAWWLCSKLPNLMIIKWRSIRVWRST